MRCGGEKTGSRRLAVEGEREVAERVGRMRGPVVHRLRLQRLQLVVVSVELYGFFRVVLINAQMSGFGGEAEFLCSTRALPVMTHSRIFEDDDRARCREGRATPQSGNSGDKIGQTVAVARCILQEGSFSALVRQALGKGRRRIYPDSFGTRLIDGNWYVCDCVVETSADEVIE
jgi:hypothetical protein